jgi:hypothetical protein
MSYTFIHSNMFWTFAGLLGGFMTAIKLLQIS